MSYMRWASTDWYVFDHVEGGLAIWSRFAGEPRQLPIYPIEVVKEFMTGERPLAEIPGWRMTSMVGRKELVWNIRVYLGEENDENLYQVSDREDETDWHRHLRKVAAREDRDALLENGTGDPQSGVPGGEDGGTPDELGGPEGV